MPSSTPELDRIPDKTLKALARSFFAQGRTYGFRFDDYVRFVNVLLDVAMSHATHRESNLGDEESAVQGLPLAGERVSIRAPQKADRAQIHAWVSDRVGRWFLLSRATGQHQTLDQLMDDAGSHFGVVEHGGEPVGIVAFLRREGDKAELRKLIGAPGMRGRGLALDATRLWVRYGRDVLGLRKIYLHTVSSNERNVRLNQQLGFRVEGLLKTEVQVDGTPHDVLRMALVTPAPTGRR
ncbi:MAG: GNAT family N-acetyltransferase [Myxococcales bacterium]|nr:GNAT family N-acetyltransferase [Myxococcales bacterium]